MTKVKIPDFTAEVSLGPAVGFYRGRVLFGNTRGAGVSPSAVHRPRGNASLFLNSTSGYLMALAWETQWQSPRGAGAPRPARPRVRRSRAASESKKVKAGCPPITIV